MPEDVSYPEPWRGENEGDSITGVITNIVAVPSKFSDKPNAAVELRTADGEERTVYASGAALRAQFEDLAPNVGDEVTVKYNGMKTSKAGNEYRSYYVDGAKGRPFVWGSQADPEPPSPSAVPESLAVQAPGAVVEADVVEDDTDDLPF